MTMSFVTLLIFMYQTNLMKKQNYLSILPYMAVTDTHNGAEQTFKLNLHNHGVGPAIIESVAMIHQTKKYDLSNFDNNIYSFLINRAPQLDSIRNFSSSTLDKGMAIPANTIYNIFAVTNSSRDYVLITNALDRLLVEEELDYEIVYKSIQNERWLITKDSKGPIKLD